MLKTKRLLQLISRRSKLADPSLLSSSSSLLPSRVYSGSQCYSTSVLNTDTNLLTRKLDLYNPTDEHQALRLMLRDFVEKEVDPQALKYNREEKFNVELFRKLGTM